MILSEDELEGLSGGTVVIRSHGVSRDVCEKIEARGMKIVDATCPFVKKIHRIVDEEGRKGRHVVIIGSCLLYTSEKTGGEKMITETLNNLLHQTAFFNLDWGNYVMIAVACFFLYLAIKHEFEPLLLVPIAFGMLLVNIYPDIMAEPYTDVQGLEHAGGLFYYFFTPVSYTHLDVYKRQL